MRPYETFKLTEQPDIADIRREARHSRVGRNQEPSGDYKPYLRNSDTKKKVRRTLKRRDKARAIKEIEKEML